MLSLSEGLTKMAFEIFEQKILPIAPIKKAWALIEHSKDLAGLTPEASKSD